ncbi:hypothetical protein KTH_42230 [Thermosporothrix hazakensis]|nr:hypothetical protein KTH_42230 [Thermosporothrix hazakensis]
MLELRSQENALLNEVISTVGSTLKMDEVLRRLLDAVMRATSCDVASIYLYDSDKERLVLASATEHYQSLVGRITIALGEGITGWAALHRKPIYLREEALSDPRFHYIPELHEEQFQSILSVPIIGKDNRLTGVITLQAVAPHEFTKQHRSFISNIAALVASAIENAQLYESTQRKLSILTSLSVLSQTISSGLYLDDMLRSLATLTVQIMEVDLCVIMLMDQTRDGEGVRNARRLTVHATAPNLNEHARMQTINVDRHTLEQLRELQNPELLVPPLEEEEEVEGGSFGQLNPLRGSKYKALISAPLIAGAEQLGLINCYSSKSRRFTSEDQTLLTTIANQVAMAIKNSYLMNQLAQKNMVKGFFEDLMQGRLELEDSLRQRARFLGCDLSKPHAVLMVEITRQEERPADSGRSGEEKRFASGGTPQTTYKSINSMVWRRVQDSFPGSVFYEQENVLTFLIALHKDVSGGRLKRWLQDLAYQLYSEYRIVLSIGIGNACRTIPDYRQGFMEAQEALQIGTSLHHEQDSMQREHFCVTHFNDLGVYRYLYKIAYMDNLRDVFQEQIAQIDTYDKRKNTDLLDTLETYLECAGNLTRTAERLYVHRNTLIQRLERLQSLCSIDLQERKNWLTLQVAIKVYKLRSRGE